jgi:hypothetical protein
MVKNYKIINGIKRINKTNKFKMKIVMKMKNSQ